MQEELYYYWLDNVPGMGRITMRKLLEVTSPRQLFEEGAKEIIFQIIIEQKRKVQVDSQPTFPFFISCM